MGDSFVTLPLLKNQKYNGPLADNKQGYRECLTSMLLLSVTEAYFPRVGMDYASAKHLTYSSAGVVRWTC